MTTRLPCVPWLVGRSRAMHADMDAASQDDTAQAAIMERHWRDALRAGNVAPDDHDARDTILSCLYHAAGTDQQQSAERMAIGLRFLSTPSVPAPVEEPDPSCPEMTLEETVAFFRQAVSARVAKPRPEPQR